MKLEAYHQSRQPQYFSLSPRCSGTSVRSSRGVAASSLTRCRGSRVAAAVFSFLVVAATPASCRGTSHCDVCALPDVEASRITFCRGRRLSFCRPHFLHLCWRDCRGSIAKWFFYLETHFQGGTTTFLLQGQLPLMTLFTGRGRHHSSSREGGAWGQCCHVEQLWLQPSWDISLWALTALLGLSVLRLSIRSPAVAEERASFLVPLTVLPVSTSSALTEHSNSKDVSFGMPGYVWQGVSMSFAPGQGTPSVLDRVFSTIEFSALPLSPLGLGTERLEE